ncbi:molybdenum cofactor guanylyltransferase [Sporosarcina sp. CAU 1771]
MKTVGVVLAGGLSRRFGSPKAFARHGEKYFYEISVDALKIHSDKVVIVSHPDLADRFPGDENVILDISEFQGLGPLAGILSAMESVEADRYIVLPCDMPHITTDVVFELIKKHENKVTAVSSGGRHHPLVSIWDYGMKERLFRTLRSRKLRVMDVLDEMEVTWIPGNELTENEGQVFMNVNTPDFLERN